MILINCYSINLYYLFIDTLFVEIRDRFASVTSSLFSNLSAVHPHNKKFLDGNRVKNIALEFNINLTYAMNENSVLSYTFTDDRKAKDIIDLFHHIRVLQHAFSNMFNLITIEITIPVSPTRYRQIESKSMHIKYSKKLLFMHN